VGVAIVRVLVAAIGLLLILGGFATAAATGPGGSLFAALFLFIPGALALAAVVLERTRYRSLHHETTLDGHGPGGGETELPGPRFRPTDERFVDPTTGVRMRVWLDARTGERRYVADP
jgi:hypothetical protein